MAKGGVERDRVARDSIVAGGSLLAVTALLLAGANWIVVTVSAAAVGAAAVAIHSRNDRRRALLGLVINAPVAEMRSRRLMPDEVAEHQESARGGAAEPDAWDVFRSAELYERFPNGFRCLVTTSDDRPIGWYCVLPLNRSAAELVMGGATLTRDITPAMIASPRHALALHIADVACTGSRYQCGLLLADLHDQVATLAAHSPRIRYVTAHAVSRSTGRALERRGFVYKAAMKTDSANRRLYIRAVPE